MNRVALTGGPLQPVPRSTQGRQWLKATGYMIAGLICLAIVPAAFVVVDHVIVVRWSNKILDLVSGL